MISRLTLPLLCALAACAVTSAEAPATHVDPRADAARSDYVIGAFDRIRISVFELKELETEETVTDEGTITLPLLGEVRVGGLTPQQAEQEIAKLLRDRRQVLDPQVSVSILEYRSRRVMVQGAVNHPGPYELLGPKTLLDVIGEAGGPNDRAGNRIYILRPLARGGEERVEIDAERLLSEADPVLNIPLQPGDIISVPYEQELLIYVNGEVRNPSAIKFSRDERMTVLRAITAAGGATERANESRVKVIRQASDGTQQVFKVNVKRIKRGRDEDLVLQRNDIVVVPTSFF